MFCQSLGQDVDATAVANQTAVDLNTTSFMRGQQATGVIAPSPSLAGAAAVAVIQTSPDNSTWTTVVTASTGVKAAKFVQFTLDRYVRAGVTVAGSAGTYSFVILGRGN